MTLDQKRAILSNNATVIDLVELYGDSISSNPLYSPILGCIPLANSSVGVLYNAVQYLPASFDISHPAKSISSLNGTYSTTISGINPLIYAAMIKSGTGLELIHKQVFYTFSTEECVLWRLANHKIVSCNNSAYSTSVSGILSDGLNTEVGRLKFTSYHFPNIFNT